MSMGGRSKTDEPCASYFGNVCTGFGNDDQTCMFCGWQRDEHQTEHHNHLSTGIYPNCPACGTALVTEDRT